MEVIERPASSRPELSRSVTRALQHSILQLCNEHIGYNHKLQILGVLCMTVDDDAQELVVKVNNTLKRVSTNNGTGPSQAAPTSHVNHSSTAPSWTLPNNSTNTDASQTPKASARDSPTQSGSSNRRQGRKAAKPTKLQRVYDDDAQNISDDDVQSEQSEPTTSTPSGVLPEQHKSPASGSAKRKPQGPHRMALPEQGEIRDSPGPIISNIHSLASALGVDLNGSLEDTERSNGARSDDVGSSYAHGAPVYMAGTVDAPGAKNATNDSGMDMDTPGSVSPYQQMNGITPSPQGMPGYPGHGKVYIEVGNEFIQVKEEGRDSPASYNSPLNLSENSSFVSMTDLQLNASSELRSRLEDGSSENLSYQYPGLAAFSMNSSLKRDFERGEYDETMDYMVDSLGAALGRKKRRRVGEEELTPEEVAEYMGSSETEPGCTFRCKFCSVENTNVQQYIQHTIGTHHTYVCHQCGKCFTTKSSLLRHRPIHTGMRRFACSICKKTFYRKDKCKAHIKRHLGPDQNPDHFATTASLSEAMENAKPVEKASTEEFVIESMDGVDKRKAQMNHYVPGTTLAEALETVKPAYKGSTDEFIVEAKNGE